MNNKFIHKQEIKEIGKSLCLFLPAEYARQLHLEKGVIVKLGIDEKKHGAFGWFAKEEE